jgi:hypothetical protein
MQLTSRALAAPRRKLGVALVLLLIAIAAIVFAWRSGPGGIVFRYAFDREEVRNYALSMSIKVVPQGTPDAQPFEGKVRASMTMQVIEKLPDGSVVLDLAVDDVETEPTSSQSVQGGRLQISLAPDGRVIDVEGTGGVFAAAGVDPGAFIAGSGGGAAQNAGSQLLFPRYPGGAVKPGDTWSSTSSVPLPYGDKKVEVRSDSRLDGYEDSPYGRAAKIHLSVRTPLDLDVTVDELAEAYATQAGEPAAPIPDAPPGARLGLSGRTLMEGDTLVRPETSELIQLRGTTTMSMRMEVKGVPTEQLEGGSTAYVFDATTTMSIVRADDS